MVGMEGRREKIEDGGMGEGKEKIEDNGKGRGGRRWKMVGGERETTTHSDSTKLIVGFREQSFYLMSFHTKHNCQVIILYHIILDPSYSLS